MPKIIQYFRERQTPCFFFVAPNKCGQVSAESARTLQYTEKEREWAVMCILTYTIIVHTEYSQSESMTDV